MQRYELLAAEQRLPARPFTDPEHTVTDARVMGRMLQRLRLEAQSWPQGQQSVEILKYARGGGRHWLVVPNAPALGGAHEVTVVGFFGVLRAGMDHATIYELEADVVAGLGRYAPVGLPGDLARSEQHQVAVHSGSDLSVVVAQQSHRRVAPQTSYHISL